MTNDKQHSLVPEAFDFLTLDLDEPTLPLILPDACR